MLKRLLLIILAVSLVLTLTACVIELENAGSMLKGAMNKYEQTVEFSDKYQEGQPMELKLDMDMAKAIIGTTEDKLAEVQFLYSTEALKPIFTVKDDEISIENRSETFNLGKVINQWDVKVSEKLPLEVELRADASEVKLDMGAVKIKDMDTAFNASSAKLYFNDRNNEQLEKIKLDADASSVNIYGAGNLGFEELNLDADASKIVLDLTGSSEKDGEVRIDANASTVKLKLPDDAGIKIIIDKYEISSVRINDGRILRYSDREYISKDYEKAERTFKIYADLNITTLTVN